MECDLVTKTKQKILKYQKQTADILLDRIICLYNFVIINLIKIVLILKFSVNRCQTASLELSITATSSYKYNNN